MSPHLKIIETDVIYFQCTKVKIRISLITKITSINWITVNDDPSLDNEDNNRNYFNDVSDEDSTDRVNKDKVSENNL